MARVASHFGFGRSATADPATIWIVKRSTDLLAFEEIYRFDGTTDTPVAGISFTNDGSTISLIDTNPPGTDVFYRFEAELSE